MRPRIVALGDSLTAGHGIGTTAAFPAVLQQRIDAEGFDYTVVNAGVSRDTSAQAAARLEQVLAGDVRVLIVALGANDGLRGLPPDSLRANIQAILDRAKRLRPAPKLVLVGMRIPPNYGRAYTERFAAIYPELAKANGAVLVPFLLDGVGGVRSLNQADGVHPTAEGQRKMAETVWRVLEPVLREGSKDKRRGTAAS